jgi:hypothetical protein
MKTYFTHNDELTLCHGCFGRFCGGRFAEF